MADIAIEHITLEKFETYQEMSATVDGDKIWYRFPLFLDLEPRAELFLAPAMVESMVQGRPVTIKDDLAVSQRLLRTYEEIQAIFKSWNNDFTVSPLQAKSRASFPKNNHVISCFSGGVDSCFTFAHFRQEITHLLHVRCFEDWTSTGDWRENVAQRQTFADGQGVKLITVETNVRQYYEDRKLSHKLIHGSILATIGVTLNPKQFLIPSSLDYQALGPWGSHPMLDHLWTTETTEVIHHGSGSKRGEKTRYIAQFQNILDQLQVCWNSSSVNCGKCSKCVRTAFVLKILGKNSKAIPEVASLKDLDVLAEHDESCQPLVTDMIELCQKLGETEIQSHLTQFLQDYKRRTFFINMTRSLIGKTGHQIYRRFFSHHDYTTRATLTSHKLS